MMVSANVSRLSAAGQPPVSQCQPHVSQCSPLVRVSLKFRVQHVIDLP